MIQSLEREQSPTTLSSEDLGEMQTQMLLLGGEAAENNRVEIIARMALRHVNGEESPRPWHERQKFIIDVLGEDLTYSAFRYELTADEAVWRMGCELETRPFRTVDVDKLDLLEVMGSDETPEKAIDMLRRAVVTGAGTTNTPPHPNEVNPENPIMGRNFGGNDALIRPRQLFPVIGRIMKVGGDLLSAAGEGVAAEVRTNINAGKNFYSYYDERQHIILWSTNGEVDAQFALRVKPFGGGGRGEQIAFTETELRVDEFGVGGKVRRTISSIYQHGDQLKLKRIIKHGEEVNQTIESATLDSIVELAEQVGHLTVA